MSSTSRIVPRDLTAGLFSLDGRVAAVTGGSSGIGAALACGLAQAGARVAILGRDRARAAPVVAEIEADGGVAAAVPCDITDRAAVEAALATIAAALGPPDVLVNSAGSAIRHAAVDYPEDALDRLLDLNLRGTFLTCQAFGRAMLAQGRGSIVNIASIGGLIAYPGCSVYHATKGGVIQLTRALAFEWIGRVRVNAIAPALFDTPLTRTAEGERVPTLEWLRARALRPERVLAPHELVGTAIYLASAASELVTGHTLPVDDGYLTV